MHNINTLPGICRFIILTFLLGKAVTLNAQPIVIETKQNAMVLQVSPAKELNMVYFGNKLSDKNEYVSINKITGLNDANMYNSAYTASGTRNLLEPALSVTHADGNKSLDLKYVSHSVTKINDNVSLLTINLKDSVYDF